MKIGTAPPMYRPPTNKPLPLSKPLALSYRLRTKYALKTNFASAHQDSQISTPSAISDGWFY
jgi:hypothetical protein